MDENKRGSFGSTIGFLLSAIGSAVGLGNIWGFPYKMGRCGGFTFLIVYLALAAFVGFAIMLSELAIGRSTGFGPVNAYKKVSKKFKWIGWLAIIAPFLIMTFYSVLGGYCIYYMVINVVGMFSGMPDSSSFGALLTNPWASIGCMVLFMLICYLINRGGVGGGIEKFNTIGMPALFVMLVIVIIRAWTLPNADVGLKYMFVPGYALKAGFFDKAPGFMEVLATAGGQMFFSLSLAMGAMITYGSYLGKNENLPKNSVIIVISDTMVAIMAGLAVIPAAVANGIAKGMAVSEIKLGGPNLLFATLQDVFHDMGTIGGIFGLIFYALVLIAAISSAISLIEAVSVTFIDHASAKGHERDRNKVLAVVCLAITLLACLVAVDGLGSNGIAPKDLFHINSKADWCADWLDFMDMISEGIAMPLGALLMSIMVGWEIKPKSLYGEIDSGYNGHIHGFYTFCIKYLCPRDHVLHPACADQHVLRSGLVQLIAASEAFRTTKQNNRNRQPSGCRFLLCRALRRRSPCSPRPDMEKAPCRSLCTALFRWGKKEDGRKKKRIGKFAAAGRLPAADGR